MIHGRDLILTIDSTYYQTQALAAAKTCEVDVNTDFIEVASPTDGGWKQYVPTILSWGLSAGLLLAERNTYNTLFKYQANKTLLTARFFDRDIGIYYKGNTYISGLKITGSVGSLITISVNFQPTGPLTPATVTEFKCGGSGKTVTGYKIDWSGAIPVIANDPDGTICWYEIDVSTKTKTRIWTSAKTMVIKDTAANVVALIESQSSATLLSKAVMVNKEEAGRVLVGPDKYTVIVNSQDKTGHEDGAYVSTF